MTHSITPPKLATLMLSFFASEPDFPQIEGDLGEEFHNCLLASGPQVARRSYWREALRNMWALAKRSSTIQVLAMAALSVFVFPLIVPPFFHWLDTFYFVSQVAGLQLFLLAIFEMTISVVLSVLLSRVLSGRERMLRMTFTGFYLLINMSIYLVFGWPDLLNIRPLYFVLNLINWALVVIAFWMGSVWVNRRRLRRLAG